MSGRALDRLLVGSVARAIEPFLPNPPVCVLGWPRLARLLAESRECIALDAKGEFKPARSMPQSALAEMGAGALVVADPQLSADELRALAAQLEAGATTILMTQGPRAMASQIALCAGLADLRQRMVGRKVLTAGTVRRL